MSEEETEFYQELREKTPEKEFFLFYTGYYTRKMTDVYFSVIIK